MTINENYILNEIRNIIESTYRKPITTQLVKNEWYAGIGHDISYGPFESKEIAIQNFILNDICKAYEAYSNY